MRTIPVCRRWAVLGLVLAAAVAHAGRAQAAYLSFNLDPQSGDGRISFAGGSTPLVGSNLSVLSIKGIDTPQNTDTTLKLELSNLNFTTGGFTTTTPANPGDFTSHLSWNYAPGGTITINGGIPALGIADGTPLLTGSFSDTTAVRPLGNTDLKVQSGAVLNVINAKLAAYFGLPVGTDYMAGISTLFSASATAPGAFSSSGYTSGQVSTTPVPEPATLVIMTVALGAGLAWRQRRMA